MTARKRGCKRLRKKKSEKKQDLSKRAKRREAEAIESGISFKVIRRLENIVAPIPDHNGKKDGLVCCVLFCLYFIYLYTKADVRSERRPQSV